VRLVQSALVINGVSNAVQAVLADARLASIPSD
jgi:hypothetical protein